MKEAKLPAELLALLKTLKNQKYATKQLFLTALNSLAGDQLINQHQLIILQHTETSGRFKGESYGEFLKQVLAYYEHKIVLIEDGAPYHGSNVVKEIKRENVDRLSIERLPAFSPDYNPNENCGKILKRIRLTSSILKPLKIYMLQS